MRVQPDGTFLELDGPTTIDPANPPSWLEPCAEFLAAWRDIQTHGLQGWMALHGVQPHPCLAEALEVFESELGQLRHEHGKQQAEDARRKRRERKPVR
ncbi:MAG: hypothetical protein AAFV77_01395 [Planctomycetota bacterium]